MTVVRDTTKHSDTSPEPCSDTLEGPEEEEPPRVRTAVDLRGDKQGQAAPTPRQKLDILGESDIIPR